MRGFDDETSIDFDDDLYFEMYLMVDSESNNWLVTYSDIITLLLCFFMIFFSTDYKSKGSIFELVDKGIIKAKATQSKPDSKPAEGKLEEGWGFSLNALKEINSMSDVKVLTQNDQVTIVFERSNFFDLGKISLNAKGDEEVRRVANQLGTLKDSIIFNIQGHADSTPVRKDPRKKYSDNMELSVYRALEVRKRLVELGFIENNIYVSGTGSIFSKHKVFDLKGELIKPEELSLERKITIRLERKK